MTPHYQNFYFHLHLEARIFDDTRCFYGQPSPKLQFNIICIMRSCGSVQGVSGPLAITEQSSRQTTTHHDGPNRHALPNAGRTSTSRDNRKHCWELELFSVLVIFYGIELDTTAPAFGLASRVCKIEVYFATRCSSFIATAALSAPLIALRRLASRLKDFS